MSQPPHITKTILLFGDQTDSWSDGLDQAYRLSGSTPWLQSFLDELTSVINKEIRAVRLDDALQKSLGVFSSLQELGERYRYTTDELGMAHCLLLHSVRAANLLQWVKRDASILINNGETQWLGISGGLITMAAWAVSENFDTLRTALLEIGRLLVRLCKFTSIKSRSVEDSPGVWGWAVVGVSLEDLSKMLEDFQQSVGIPSLKRAKPGVTGAGWSTIIGPPSVLEQFVKQCPAMKRVAKNPLKIHALQHTIDLVQQDLDFIVGNNTALLDKPVRSNDLSLWGMDFPDTRYANWGDMLKAICSQVLSRGLHIPNAIGKMNETLHDAKSVRVIEVGATSHTSYLVGTLERIAGEVVLQDANSLLQPQNEREAPGEPVGRIAIVGVSGRGPKCNNIDEFWDVLMNKVDTCTEVPKDRFDVDEFYCKEHGGRGDQKCTMTTKYGCFMDGPGHFDSRFFHISPREAMLMDPGHRHFLMSAYEALEMAGYSDGKAKSVDPNRIATFYGQVTDDWHDQSHPTLGCDPYTLPGVQRAFGPGRLAWQFKWEGPTYSLDSACASTTSSIHLACMSLQTGDIDMAVAGASNILNYPHSFTSLSKSGVLSDTGNCKTYRDDADGYCRADFIGSVVLKRLEDAEADNDRILAVIASSGRNHSGNSTSITTSDAGAQERLFHKVLRKAHISAHDISYVEMHGTGTQVGDPAEMGAVGNLLKHTSRSDGPIPVGGVKANFGHGEGAAGMASLMKCLKMFETNVIPPQAGMPHPLNPKFPPLEDLNVEILSEPKDFKRKGKAPRRILLNNFDAAGGNSCMIIEEYMQNKGGKHNASMADPRSSHVVALSARTPAAHSANKRQLLAYLRANPNIKIEDIAYTTTARRMHHPHRFSCVASSVDGIITKLESDIAGQDTSTSATPPSRVSPVVFVFTGQGSHYAGMGRELYSSSPAFRESVDLCVRIADQHGFPSFVNLLTDDGIDMASKTTTQTQLAVLTLEIGLAAFWKSVGVKPAMVMGHSLGEYAALHVSGVLSVADAIYLVGQRGALLLDRCEADTFAMLAVTLSATEVKDFLESHSQFSSCGISCINSTTATVISGSSSDIEQLQSKLTTRSKALAVPYGFHSFQVDPILADYKTIASGVTFLTPKIPVASTLLGSVVNSQGVFNSQYLTQQTRQPVDFVGALNAIKEELIDPVWLELGPSKVCTSFVKTTLSPTAGKTMSSLEGSGNIPAWTSISKCMASLHLQGVVIDWLAFHRPYEQRLEMLNLPAYAWDMKDYWVTFSEARHGDQKSAAVSTSSTTSHPTMIATFAQHVVKESFADKKISVTLCASLAEPGLSAVFDGHRMQNLAICPGSAFCEAGFAAAVYALEASGRASDANVAKLSVRNPRMNRPLTKNLVGADGDLFTTVTMDKGSNDIQISWKAAAATSKSSTYHLGSCVLRVCPDIVGLQATWDKTSYFIQARMVDVIRSAKEGRGHRFQSDIFYALFAPTVEYDSEFKTLQEAFVSTDFSEAAAEVTLKSHPAGTRFVASPYWGESITHLAGFAVNANPQNFKTAFGSCYINSGFESFEQTVPFEAGRTYMTYVRVVDKDRENKTCEVFVFDSDERLVAQCSGLGFHLVSNTVLKQSLGGKDNTPEPHSQSQPKTIKNPVAQKIQETEKEVHEEQVSNSSSSLDGVFEVIIQTIVAETGMSVDDLTDDTKVADIGIDSIMSIEIASKVSDATGMELAPSFIIEVATIGDLRREFADAPVATPSTSSDSDLVLDGASDDDDTVSSLSSQRESDYVKVSKPPTKSENVATAAQELNASKQELPSAVQTHPPQVENELPLPSVKFTLLQSAGRLKGVRTKPSAPFFMIADGTGSVATYLHLPSSIKSKMAIYGIDSPYLHCPTRLTPDVGIPGAAKLIAEALVKKQPEGLPFWIGGFSGGAMMAYEVCRQLSDAGHTIQGLLLIDMCSPRLSNLPRDDEAGLVMFEAISGEDESGLWQGSENNRRHLQSLFASVAAYNPPALHEGQQPPAKRTALIWAERGMIDRCSHSTRFNQLTQELNMSTTAYPGFMQDPKLGSVMWSLPHKTSADLGPNGWDKFVGSESLLCASIDADHLQMPTPGYASLLAEQMDRAFDFFRKE